MADLLVRPGAEPPSLFLRRRHDLDTPKLFHAGGDPRLATLVAARGVFAERLAIGGGYRSLGRQDAGGRALCHPLCPDELGHRGSKILVAKEVSRSLVNHRTAPLPADSPA